MSALSHVQASVPVTAPVAALTVEQEPVGWLHTLHMELAQKEQQLTFSPNDPFGEIGEDYDPTYVCISQPVYIAAPVAAPVQVWQDMTIFPTNVWVFVFVPGHGPARAINRDGKWVSHANGRIITKATHWMTLPEEPK